MKTIKPPASCNVYTPAVLANQMVTALLGHGQQLRWLEPCVGKGALLRALSDNKVPPTQICGIDLCKKKETADLLGRVHRGIEFLAWAKKIPERFDRIVANPPYIAISQLPESVQIAAMNTVEPSGGTVPKGANLWFAFLCASLSLLKPGGGLAFVLPAAFEYANYARELRRQLPEQFAMVDVHRCRTPIFEKVDDGSIVVICRGYGQKPQVCLRHEHATLGNLVAAIKDFKPAANSAVSTSPVTNSENLIRFDSIASVGLGAVTGDAAFFLMSEVRRKNLGLPLSAMVPVLSRSRQLTTSIMDEKTWTSQKSAGERVWMLCPTDRALQNQKVATYLASDWAVEARKRYKVKNRPEWFRPLLPESPHGFLSGMVSSGPWICLNDKQSLTATNTLYVIHFRESLTKSAQCAWALMLLTSSVRQQWRQVCRKYALGLPKLEPGDLAGLLLPRPKTLEGMVKPYKQAVAFLLNGEELKAQSLADKWT